MRQRRHRLCGAAGAVSSVAMQVREVMMRGVGVIAPDATLQQAAAKMRESDAGLLPVCDGERLLGMLTDRDITVRATALGGDPQGVTVQQIMTPDVVFCFEDDDATVAVRLMEEYQVRRLPVLDHEHRLVGMVSFNYLTGQAGDDHARAALEPAP
jgi:CBS domain-containing protein